MAKHVSTHIQFIIKIKACKIKTREVLIKIREAFNIIKVSRIQTKEEEVYKCRYRHNNHRNNKHRNANIKEIAIKVINVNFCIQTEMISMLLIKINSEMQKIGTNLP